MVRINDETAYFNNQANNPVIRTPNHSSPARGTTGNRGNHPPGGGSGGATGAGSGSGSGKHGGGGSGSGNTNINNSSSNATSGK